MNNKFKFFSGLLACTLFSSMFAASPKAVEANTKPKQDTELVFVIDKSGSMYDLADDTIGSFNSVIEEQKSPDKDGNVYVTTVMFNKESEKIHDRKNIKDIEKITKKEYCPGGSTALLDTLGNTITELSKNESAKKNKVMFVVITDGYENGSREFKKETVKKLVDEKTKENWQFIFLGANIDSFKESSDIGISKKHTRNFGASGEGIKEAFACVRTAINQMRNNEEINLDETKHNADVEIVKSKK